MSRNNEKNIKKHNDKFHKMQQNKKDAEVLRKQKLSEIIKKYSAQNAEKTDL